MGRTCRGILLVAAIATFVSGCAQLPVISSRNRELEAAQAHRQMMLSLADKVQTSLSTGDLSGAQRAALAYGAAPDADRKMVAEWRRQIWVMSESWRDGESSPRARPAIKGAVEEIKRQYPRESKMSRAAFRRWVATQGATQGAPLFSKIDVRKDNVQLWVAGDKMPDLAFNMEKLVKVNDVLVARCGCDGRTNVGAIDTGFPVYLVRLDPETSQSQVIVLPR
jgi:hypothetical protein